MRPENLPDGEFRGGHNRTPFSSDVAGPFEPLARSQELHRLFPGLEEEQSLEEHAPWTPGGCRFSEGTHRLCGGGTGPCRFGRCWPLLSFCSRVLFRVTWGLELVTIQTKWGVGILSISSFFWAGKVTLGRTEAVKTAVTIGPWADSHVESHCGQRGLGETTAHTATPSASW